MDVDEVRTPVSLPASLVFVDVESTGAHPLRDRITEIAILRVEEGVLVERWSSLVAPGVPVPPLIEQITGISDQMLVGAPDFAALADEIEQRLHGAVFVAHNARFDYGFIKNSFARIGREFDAEVLCTVKLSRALYPQFHRHGLDALIERHGLECSARHRALGDAEALWAFVQLAQQQFKPETLARALTKAMKSPPAAPGLAVGVLEAIPDVAGIYLLHAEPEPPAGNRLDRPLFVGRGQSLRGRVREHFSGEARKGKDAELRTRTRRVEWVEAAGELGAMLLEQEAVRRLRPRYNAIPRSADEAFALRLLPARRRAPIWQRQPLAGSDPLGWEDCLGVFRNADELERRLQDLALVHELCPRRLGLDSGGSGPCAAHLQGECAGVCAGKESVEAHDERLRSALTGLGLKPWPWPGAVVVVERDEEHGREGWHVFDQWCHLGSVERVEALAGVDRSRRFDIDVWRMLARWFVQEEHRAAARALDEILSPGPLPAAAR